MIRITKKIIFPLLVLIAGVAFYLSWCITYSSTYPGVWTDIGIYSITIVFVLSGIFGVLLSLLSEKKE